MAEPHITVLFTFCDKSTQENQYLLTPMGKLEARDDFEKASQWAEDNFKIWAKAPHVVKCVWSQPESPDAVNEFTCPCLQAQKEQASA